MSAAGLEPAACSFGRSRSIQLSYADPAGVNAPGRNRTCGLRLRKPALCPLSYGCLAASAKTDVTVAQRLGSQDSNLEHRDSESRVLPLHHSPMAFDLKSSGACASAVIQTKPRKRERPRRNVSGGASCSACGVLYTRRLSRASQPDEKRRCRRWTNPSAGITCPAMKKVGDMTLFLTFGTLSLSFGYVKASNRFAHPCGMRKYDPAASSDRGSLASTSERAAFPAHGLVSTAATFGRATAQPKGASSDASSGVQKTGLFERPPYVLTPWNPRNLSPRAVFA